MIYEEIYSDQPHYHPFDCDHYREHYNPHKARIKDIIWDHLDWINEQYELGNIRDCVLENLQRALLCNTVYLGYDAFECQNCGNFFHYYHKCHSRFCNSCGVKNQKLLAARAESMCLDVHHRHMVFTIPEEYRLIFRKYRDAIDLLFIASRNTLYKIVNENIYRKEKRKHYKTGKIRNDKDNVYLYRNFKYQKIPGFISTIHTFGRDLKWNPHIHLLIAEAVYNPKKDKLEPFTYFNYQNLRKTWQYELNHLLLDRFGKSFREMMDDCYKTNYKGLYVYAKDTKNNKDNNDNGSASYSKNVKGCVNYMMRYAARPAMAESRIESYDKENDKVVWFYDDHTTGDHITVEESGLDLLKKMIIHIHDKFFRTVRYYGFYNNKERKLLSHIYDLHGQKNKMARSKEEREKQLNKSKRKLRFRTFLRDTYNRDIKLCKCGSYMVYVGSYNPLEEKHNDRQYREECINDMRRMRIPRIPRPA